MPNRRPTTAWLTLVLIAVVLLPAAYMGVYYAMVDRMFLEWGTTPIYRVEGDAIGVLFEPAHWVDRHVRPGYWD